MIKIILSSLFVAAALSLCGQTALAVSPNALENAYWRFEEGISGADVAINSGAVVDSSSGNHMGPGGAASSPNYTNTVAPFTLRSGAGNTRALNFSFHSGGGDDVFTSSRNIDNGIIAPGGGFTIEAAFRPDAVTFPGGPYQAIVSKNGTPTGSLPTMTLKVRGDNGKLQLEQFDGAGTQVGVQSTAALAAGQWYAAAAVNTGTNLSLYLRGTSDLDYVFQGSVPVNGALYQGTANDWDKAWSIGRSVFGASGDDGAPNDWFAGIIDEVRLSNRALTPSEFLFEAVPEPGTIALLTCMLFGLTGCCRPTRKRG